MQMLYIVTKGTADATLASVPLHIAANGSYRSDRRSPCSSRGPDGPGDRR